MTKKYLTFVAGSAKVAIKKKAMTERVSTQKRKKRSCAEAESAAVRFCAEDRSRAVRDERNVSRVKGQECGRCARIQVVPRISGGSPAGMAAEAARVSFALNQIGSGRFFAPKRSVNGNEQRASQDL